MPYQASDTVTVTVQAATDAATDAELAGLSLAAPDGSLVPLRDAGSLAETAFAAATASYKAVLPAGAGQVTVAAVPRGCRGDGGDHAGGCRCDAGNGHQVAVAPGQTQSITVTVTAADGATVKTWTVEAQRSTPMAICDRTPAVRDAILAKLSGVTDCAAVTAAHLAGITGDPEPERQEHRQPQGGGFRRADRTDQLYLDGNELTGLPAGLFDGLAALNGLYLGKIPSQACRRGYSTACRILGFVSQRHRSRRIAGRTVRRPAEAVQLDISIMNSPHCRMAFSSG